MFLAPYVLPSPVKARLAGVAYVLACAVTLSAFACLLCWPLALVWLIS